MNKRATATSERASSSEPLKKRAISHLQARASLSKKGRYRICELEASIYRLPLQFAHEHSSKTSIQPRTQTGD